MAKKRKNPVEHIASATVHSIHGLRAAWRCELSFRLETVVIPILLPIAFWLGTSPAQRALLVVSLLAIPVVELLNSALESVVDRIGPELHELSGRAKDMGSAAVLMVLMAAAAVWAIVACARWVG